MSKRPSTRLTDRREPSSLAVADLAASATRTSTNRSYADARVRFHAWWCLQPVRKRSIIGFDSQLATYLTELFNTRRGGVSLARHTFFGLLAVAPHLKMRLHLSYRCLRAYIRLRPSVSWPPMPWPVVLAVAEYLASVGKLREGVAVLVSAHCWLRVGEVVGLRHENFAASNDVRLGMVLPYAVLTVHDTKTKRFDSVEVTRRDVAALLSWMQDGIGTRLFPFTRSHLEDSLRAACNALGLAHCGYVWHSLRHGGATDACLGHMPFYDIMLRGRWQSERSARLYCQTGRALLLQHSLPESVVTRGRELDSNVLALFRKATRSIHSLSSNNTPKPSGTKKATFIFTSSL